MSFLIKFNMFWTLNKTNFHHFIEQNIGAIFHWSSGLIAIKQNEVICFNSRKKLSNPN